MTSAVLNQLAPAMMASLVAIQTVDVVRGGTRAGGLASMAALIAIVAIAYRRPSLIVSAGLGIIAVLCIDLVLLTC
jgi:Branched-chain amino acid transport protein (AzlD)